MSTIHHLGHAELLHICMLTACCRCLGRIEQGRPLSGLLAQHVLLGQAFQRTLHFCNSKTFKGNKLVSWLSLADTIRYTSFQRDRLLGKAERLEWFKHGGVLDNGKGLAEAYKMAPKQENDSVLEEKWPYHAGLVFSSVICISFYLRITYVSGECI